MSTSPERCLGELLKDIDKDDEFDDWNSKSAIKCKSSKTALESSGGKNYSILFSNILSSNSLDTYFFLPKKYAKIYTLFSKENILSSFKSQKMTKHLQKSLLEIPKQAISIIIKEIQGLFEVVIKNKNGNYFFSDLLKLCNKEQRIKILLELSDKLSEICTDEFGSHPIQHLIEASTSEEEYKLILASFIDSNKILIACLNKNGSFVIQKLIVHIPEKYRNDFNLLFVQLLCMLSRDMYGVCTVKKFIAHTNNVSVIKSIKKAISNNFVNIASNLYGNYLIQYLLEKWWNTDEGVFLKNIIFSKFQILANNHYSSYICFLYLKLSNSEEKKNLETSLIKNQFGYINDKFKNLIPLYLNKNSS